MNKLNCSIVTFGSSDYFKLTSQRLINDAKKTNWFSNTFLYNEYDLIPIAKNKEAPDIINDFYARTYEWSIQSFIYYYWWKPYMVLKAMREIKKNEILMWSDAGNSINFAAEKKFFDYLDICDSGAGFVGFGANKNTYGKFPPEWQHTSVEILDLLNMNTDQILNTDQLASGLFFVKKNDFCMDLLEEWRNHAKNNLFEPTATESYKIYKNFHAHKHDQSLLSLVVKKRWDVINDGLLPGKEYSDTDYSIFYPVLATRVRDSHINTWKWGYPNEHQTRGKYPEVPVITKHFRETETYNDENSLGNFSQ